VCNAKTMIIIVYKDQHHS